MSERYINECVELTHDCEIGLKGERATVSELHGGWMKLTFSGRGAGFGNVIHTGKDYKFLRTVGGRWTRSGRMLKYDGNEVIYLERIQHGPALAPSVCDAVAEYVCDMLNAVDLDKLQQRWMERS